MEIVTRDQWGSKSKWKYGDMKLPAATAFLHHTVTQSTNFPYKDARQIENIGIGRFGQGSYSFVVHPTGMILEMAGTKTGAHTEDRNSTSFGIALIGNYTNVPPTVEQSESVQWLIYYLKHEKSWLKDRASLIPHRSITPTECPGNKAMDALDQFRVPWIPPPPQETRPMYVPPLDLEPIVAELRAPEGGVWLLAESGAIYAFGGAVHKGGANGQDYFIGRSGAILEPYGDGYTIVATSGERYDYR